MEGDKDVLDGWCLYEERTVGTSGSNSSDSESIEIISEDETGNYQIYSKNYFKPECNTSPGSEVTSSMLDNDTSLHTLDNTTDITEYKENDPTHLTVEEGTEACEMKSKPSECEIEPTECERFH
uniref:Uncharacterized protein n=1 Tax=Cacopsylla melanoneura TaxID=428564 RepID=A0A8D8WEG1_9HEMI